MERQIITIDESFEGVVKQDGNFYVYDGDLTIYSDCVCNINLIVKGSLTVKGIQTIESNQL